MRLLESQIRSIVKQELKKILFEDDTQTNMSDEVSYVTRALGDSDWANKVRDFIQSNTVDGIFYGDKHNMNGMEYAIREIAKFMSNAMPNNKMGSLLYQDANNTTVEEYNNKLKELLGFDLSFEGSSPSTFVDRDKLAFVTYHMIQRNKNKKNLPYAIAYEMGNAERKIQQVYSGKNTELKDYNRANREKFDKEWEETAAPEDAPLGKYAFSPQRQNTINPPPKEKNTKIESMILASLSKHVAGTTPMSSNAAQIIKTLLEQGLYKDVFKAPTVDKLYRGMGVTEEYIQNLGINPNELNEELGKENIEDMLGRRKAKVIERQFTFKPRGKTFASSWTTSPKVAADFASTNAPTKGTYMVIMEAETDLNDGSFLDAAGFYEIDNLASFSSEQEVFGLGEITVSKIYVLLQVK